LAEVELLAAAEAHQDRAVVLAEVHDGPVLVLHGAVRRADPVPAAEARHGALLRGRARDGLCAGPPSSPPPVAGGIPAGRTGTGSQDLSRGERCATSGRSRATWARRAGAGWGHDRARRLDDRASCPR